MTNETVVSSSDNVDQSDEDSNNDIIIKHVKTYDVPDENENFPEYQPFVLVASIDGLRQRKPDEKSDLNESLTENLKGVDSKGIHKYSLLKLDILFFGKFQNISYFFFFNFLQ